MRIGKARWAGAFLATIACMSGSELARGGVLAPDSLVDGASQAVWGDRWWQWVLSFPEGQNPLTDPTGEFSGLGDQGEVFFLAGTVSGPATRVATIQVGQTLFIPIVPVVSPIPFFGSSEAEVRADAAATLGEASDLFLTINGVDADLPPSTTSLLDFYQTTPPGTFPLTFVENNIFGVPVGTYDSVAVGYWVMLDGLSVGEHTIHFGGQFSGTPSLGYAPFETDITYVVNVLAVPEPSTVILASLGGLTLAIVRLRRRR